MKKDRARGQKTPNRIKHLVNTSIKFLVRHYDLKDGELLLIENGNEIEITKIIKK